MWLAEQRAAEGEILDILVAANEAFNNSLGHSRQPRSIAVRVDASIHEGIVEIAIRDHGRWRDDRRGTDGPGLGLPLMHALMDTVEVEVAREGTTVRLRRVLGPSPARIGEAASAPTQERLELLGRNPIFAPLPGTMLERVAAQLIPFSAAADETIIREGAGGELFYVIGKGELRVTAESCHVATLGPADHVGEIALLRDVARTATIVATTPAELYALARDDFLSAVASHEASTRAAQSIVAARLAGLEGALQRVHLPHA